MECNFIHKLAVAQVPALMWKSQMIFLIYNVSAFFTDILCSIVIGVANYMIFEVMNSIHSAMTDPRDDMNSA
jgi:hypothetical protein